MATKTTANGAAAAAAAAPAAVDESGPLKLVLLPAKIGTAINASPFSTKLLTFVRLAGLEHELVRSSLASNQNPRKLWPYAIHGGAIIPDSSAIARYLAAAYPETAGKLFPTDPKQKNLAHVVSRMMEEALFPIALWYRFIDPANAPYTADAYFGRMPWPIRKMVVKKVFGGTAERLRMQGVGKRPEPELREMMEADLAALSGILGDGPYLLGRQPCYADAMLFGLLDTGLWDGVPNTCFRDAIRAHPNMVAYAARIRAEHFKDFGTGESGRL